MEHRFFSNSGLQVSVLGLGTLMWGADTSSEDAQEILDIYLEAGGSLIDTSLSYGGEELIAPSVLGKLISQELREELTISAHIGFRGGRIDASRGRIRRELNTLLREMNTDYVDLVTVAGADSHTPLEETVETMADIIREGKARYVGFASMPVWRLAIATQMLKERTGLTATAASLPFSLLERHREPEKLFEFAQHSQIGIAAYSPLAGGVLTGKYRSTIPATSRGATDHLRHMVEPYLTPNARRVTEAAAKASEGLTRTMADVSLSWLLSRPQVTTAICGPRTPAQAREIFSSSLQELPPQIANALSDVSAPR